ncbi:MAG: class I SAM-dependent methyltransferase [bacterium]
MPQLIHRQWKRPDWLLLALLVPGVALVFGLGWRFLGGAGLVLGLICATSVLITLQLMTHRSVLHGLEWHLRHTQGLIALHQLVRPRFPLPAMAGWACTPELASVLAGLVLERRPALVVEAGSGISSLIVGYLLEQQGAGRCYSLDHSVSFAEQTTRLLERHGLSERVTVLGAPLEPVTIAGQQWPWYPREGLPSAPPIDLLIVDGPPMLSYPLARFPALPLLASQLAPDAIIVVHDADRPDEREVVRRWMSEYPELERQFIDSERGIAVLRRRPSAARKSE